MVFTTAGFGGLIPMHRLGGKCIASFAVLAATLWCTYTTPLSAQTRLLDEIRVGALAHSVDANGSEGGVDLNLELLLRRPAIAYSGVLANVLLRPRVHVGASLNSEDDTNQIYAGLTWDLPLRDRWSLDLSFGGAWHDGPTGAGPGDSYGCSVNFREALSLGYALDDRWRIYGTVSHMSNANLCDRNTGLTSVGLRLGYSLK